MHRAAHELGIPHQLHHALRPRRDGRGPDRAPRACCATLQDETGGFLTYIPLAYHPDHNELGEELGRVGHRHDRATRTCKNIAVGRLFLDNIPHVKTHWPMVTPFLSQIALSFGCDDVEGTVVYERIYHEAGAHTAHAHALHRAGAADPRGREAAGRARQPLPAGARASSTTRRRSRRCAAAPRCRWCTPHEARPDSLDQLLPGLRRDRPGPRAVSAPSW